MSNNNSGFFTFLTGVVAGAVIGILYAPDKGKNTRDKLSYQLDKYSETLQELIDQLMEEKEYETNEARTEGEKVITEIKSKANNIMKEVDALKRQIINQNN